MGRNKYREEDFPPAGTILQMPLADGRIGLCRVLRVSSDPGAPAAIVTASSWIGKSPPKLDSEAVRDTLYLTHHSWDGQPERTWVSEPPPDSFVVLGQIDLPDREKDPTCYSYSAWQALALQVLTQWRWENDRANLEKDEREREKEEQTQRSEQNRVRDKYLNSITLAELFDKNLFPRWNDYPPSKAKKGTKLILQELIESLQNMPSLGDSEIKHCIRKSVEELNDLDQSNDYFIETVIRDDLYEVFEEILSAAKAPHLVESIDEWRDW